jgi:hypothetical protein
MEAMRQSWSDDRLDHLSDRVEMGFDQVDQRFKQVDQRFEQVDRRFDRLEDRFDRLQQGIMVVGGGLIGSLVLALAGLFTSLN